MDFIWKARVLPWIAGLRPPIHRPLRPFHMKRPKSAALRVHKPCPAGGKLLRTFPQSLEFASRIPHSPGAISSSIQFISGFQATQSLYLFGFVTKPSSWRQCGQASPRLRRSNFTPTFFTDLGRDPSEIRNLNINLAGFISCVQLLLVMGQGIEAASLSDRFLKASPSLRIAG